MGRNAMNNVVSLEDFRQKKDPNFVKVGDIVEWEDYDSEVYRDKVVQITNIPQTYSVESIDLSFKEHFVVHFEGGFSVAASVLKRKVIKRKVV